MKYCFKISGKRRIKTLKKMNKLDTKSFNGESFGEKTFKVLKVLLSEGLMF